MLNDRRRRIAAAFSAAARRYEDAAAVQRHAAGTLAARVLAQGLPDQPGVLEIGCGTGLLSRALLSGIEGGRFLLTDLSPAMVAACRQGLADPRVAFAVMDGERPEAAGGGFDLVVSSLAAQWFQDPGMALARQAALLRPGGILAVALLGPETFAEWRRALAAEGLSAGVLPFPDAVPWPPGGKGGVEREAVISAHGDGRAFLHSLKAIGAHVAASGHRPLNAGELRRVLRRLGEGMTVTYDVLYGVWVKA
ncbi:MAG: methyltransferase domain-containing protein [Rhodospirillales bacterium]|nr:methyltransferase domain-containing protein [Rhodospirillales bacterium]